MTVYDMGVASEWVVYIDGNASMPSSLSDHISWGVVVPS